MCRGLSRRQLSCPESIASSVMGKGRFTESGLPFGRALQGWWAGMWSLKKAAVWQQTASSEKWACSLQTHIRSAGFALWSSPHIKKGLTLRWRETRTWLKPARCQRERKVHATIRLSFLVFTGTCWQTLFSIMSSCCSGSWNKRPLPCKAFPLLRKRSHGKTLRTVCVRISFLVKNDHVWIENTHQA